MLNRNSVLAKELEKRNLPDLLTAPNGEKVTTVEKWESEMRPYWKNVLLEHCYGKTPVYVQPIIETKTNNIDFAGKAVWETVSFTFRVNGKEHTVPTQLIYPAGAKNCPFFIYLNFRPDIPDRYLPVEEMIDNGFGIFSVCYNDVTTDSGDFTSGLAGLFEEETRAPNATGKIRYWSYMASQMMDYLQTREEADKAGIGIAGHSRLGKTALLTAAMDERFAFVCTNDSGCSGAALTRGRSDSGEPVESICRMFPYWFCPNYQAYVGRENEMPFDQHALVALVAPRAVYIGGAIEDVWADNDNQFLSGVAASEIWELYGKVGMISPDRLPVLGDTWTDGMVGFHLRAGKHYHSRTDWLVYMDAVKKLLKNKHMVEHFDKGQAMKIKPTKGQLNFLSWEFGVFFHFGIRSFYPGHKDWDGNAMDASAFNPDKLDCEEWVKMVKEVGATYAILTTKHHDGFALWPSKYSSYSVAQTPWKDGKGDVVREFVDACRKYGIKVGLYYSPAQWGSHAIKFENGKAYDDYFINQISELLSGYGKIDYLWFDGCGSEGHEYDKKRIVAEIFRLQPEIQTFCDPEWSPCVRWVGNEDGYASLDNPLAVSAWDFSELTGKSVELSQTFCLPAECDCKLRDTWFYDHNENTIKSLDELFGMYEASVGHGSNFLLNVGPDNHGKINAQDKARMLELGQKIKDVYGVPANDYGEMEKDGDSYSIARPDITKPMVEMGKSKPVNRIVITEDITDGQAVKGFKVYVHLPRYRHKRILAYIGTTIGNKVICQIPTVCPSKITVEITDSDGEHKIKDIKAYFAK